MFRRLLFPAVILVLCFGEGVEVADACSPSPWSYDSLAEDSAALLYGKVADTAEEGRQAAVEVIHYVGPGAAPKLVHLPATEPDPGTLPEGDTCPDFSMKFREGATYLFFLQNTGSSVELLHPDWITAMEVENRYVRSNIHGDQEEATALVQRYAADRGQTVKAPGKGYPAWGDPRIGTPWVIALTLAAILLIAARIYGVDRSRR